MNSHPPIRAGLWGAHRGAALAEPVWPAAAARWLLGPVLALALVVALSLLQFNQPLFLWLNHGLAWTPPALAASLTALGDTHVALALLLPWVVLRRDASLALILALLVGTLLVQGFKNAFDALRPAGVLALDAFRVVGPALRSHAFPSGHSATAFMVAGLLLGFGVRGWRCWLVLALAALVALSRVVVGAHWPVDVLAGAAVGWFSGLCGLWLASWAVVLQRPAVHRVILAILALSTAWLLYGFDSGYPQARWLEMLVGVLGLAFLAKGLFVRK